MALCCILGISDLPQEKQLEWSFCILGTGNLVINSCDVGVGGECFCLLSVLLLLIIMTDEPRIICHHHGSQKALPQMIF